MVLDKSDINDLDSKTIEILKIERPKYEVVEEKKELLTEEEREFLKYYMRYMYLQEKDKLIGIRKKDSQIWLLVSESCGYTYRYNSQAFKGLEKDRKYTLEELGLEEN